MYADDLILIAPSVSELQTMVNICCQQLQEIDLRINDSKSTCIRIGKRWFEKCNPIMTPTGQIKWNTQLNYLGIDIPAGKKYLCCYDRLKSKFYASFNAIYCKLGKINNPIVSLNLIATISLPCLMYAIEAQCLNKTFISSLDHPWSRVFMKILATYSMNSVRESQYYLNYLPMLHMINLRKVRFYKNLKNSPNSCLRLLYNDSSCILEMSRIATYYRTDLNTLIYEPELIIVEFFKYEIGGII